MKKILSSFVVLLAMVGFGYCGSRTHGQPRAQDGSPVDTAVFSGVDYATATTLFSSTNSLQIFIGEGALIGFIASSNTTSTDFILFRDTGSVLLTDSDTLTNNEITRVYLSTETAYAGGIAPAKGLGTSYRFLEPIRCINGATGRFVGATQFVRILYLYNRFAGGDRK